ncbi:hypothetical protein GCM10022259_22900 [Aquimarina mytili]
MVALAIYFCTTLPFLHDIITEKGTGVKDWVPDLGIEEFFTTVNEEGKKRVNGFTSYRTFIYFFLLHLFAAIGWAGWHKDATGKPYKFLLLIPAILTAYTTVIILLDARATQFNEPGTKLFIALMITAILMVIFFVKYFKKQNEK